MNQRKFKLKSPIALKKIVNYNYTTYINDCLHLHSEINTGQILREWHDLGSRAIVSGSFYDGVTFFAEVWRDNLIPVN